MNFFDLHCDTAYRCYTQNLNFTDHSLAVTLQKAGCFKKWYQCFAIFVDENLQEPSKFYKNEIHFFSKQVKYKSNNLTPIFTVEGGTLIENDLSRVKTLFDDKIKALTLTWNGENQLAGGADTDVGLKPFGKEVIAEFNRFGIFTDLSHLNKKSFYDAIEIADKPIVTHSCCESICQHKRNLDDSQIKLLAQKGGIFGLCLYPSFLGEGDVFQNIYKNIYHLLDLGLEGFLAIGSDFDGADMSNRLYDISYIPLLYDFLKQHGINEQILDKIFFKNAFNFFKGEV